MKIRKPILQALMLLPLLFSIGCSAQALGSADTGSEGVTLTEQAPTAAGAGGLADKDTEIARPAGWTEETHGKSTDPDYEVVFPQDEVNRIDITIAPEDWQAMLDDMTAKYGEAGTQQGAADGRGGQAQPPAQGLPQRPQENVDGQPFPQPPQGGAENQQDQALPLDQQGDNQGQRGQAPFQPPADGDVPQAGGFQRPGPGGDGGGWAMLGGEDDDNPIWVPVTIEFEDGTWTSVGMRFKGNSSLNASWRNGTLKLPFRLDFDQFEDAAPETEDQRFYGFQKLTFSSNFNDASFLHEKVAADLFREAGVAAAHTAFYRVYVDYGEGPVYFGLYTMVEVIEDTVIETQFGSDEGNVYKPTGSGASFAAGSFTEASFDKQTNEDDADWSDIRALFDALHADTRTTDPAAWRVGLEAVFDVDGFLRWLAVNTVMQNWDTYGVMAHNYYLYHDPDTDLLTWIPWDNNEALQGGGGGRGALSLDMSGVGDRWPLIRYLLDDTSYRPQYDAYVDEFTHTVFTPERMTVTYETLHDLIAPYVTGDEGEGAAYTLLNAPAAFDRGLQQLIQQVDDRQAAVDAYLATRE